jgi:hypothetical protein
VRVRGFNGTPPTAAPDLIEICCLLHEILANKHELLFFTYIPCILILSKFFYTPTDAQVNRLKNNFRIYIKIDIKTAPTCFGAVTPSSGSALLVLAKVTAVKIAN